MKKYPGNDILLNCLIGIIPIPERANEVIEIGRQLVSATKYDDVKLDAYRIMAEAYKSMGEYALCKQAIEKIPETYFSNLYVKADLLDGEEKYEAANKEKNLCLEHMIYMLYILADHYTAQGDTDKAIIQLEIARNVLNSFESDFATQYTRSAYDPEEIENINKRITDLKSKK